MKKVVLQANKGVQLYKFLEQELPQISFGNMQKILRKKDVIINGKRCSTNVFLNAKDSVTIFYSDDMEKTLFNIFYEDDNVLLVHKKRGIEVCDGDYNIQNVLEQKYQGLQAVHRLDRNTEGLVVFAKNQKVKDEIVKAFTSDAVEKYYYAVVEGVVQEKQKVLNLFLFCDKAKKYSYISKVKKTNYVAIKTAYTLVQSSKNQSLLSVCIHNGKTHQIRASLAFSGNAIVGDGKYGRNDSGKKYQELYAYKIKFNIEKSSFLSYLNLISFELNLSQLKINLE